MDENLKRTIRDWIEERVDAVGFAPADRFSEAPTGHRPEDICEDANTVIVFGRIVPKGVLKSPSYNLHLLHRSYHSVYPYLDNLGMELANLIEKHGHLAVQIPSFAPLVYKEIEPWGILSLKHAAHLAGLGAFGRNGLLHNPEYGTLLRLGAVVTSAALPGDPVIEEEPCPEECNACLETCPHEAFVKDGSFNKLTCMFNIIKHGIYPLALQSEEGMKNIEMIINTAGYNYWLKCDECLQVCPNNFQEST